MNSKREMKKDDYGTFFYKIRNGSLPFEYDTENTLRKIHSSIEKKDRNLVCGIVSAIFANYVSMRFDKNTSWIWFVISILGIFIVLQGVLVVVNIVGTKIKNYKDYKKNDMYDEEQEQIQDLFFEKIIVQTTYVFSVIKRCKELQGDKEKEPLCYMYAIQGVYAMRKVCVELGSIAFDGSDERLKKFINLIGKHNIKKVLDIITESMQDVDGIMKNYEGEIGIIDILEEDKTRLNNLKKQFNINIDNEPICSEKKTDINDGNRMNNTTQDTVSVKENRSQKSTNRSRKKRDKNKIPTDIS